MERGIRGDVRHEGARRVRCEKLKPKTGAHICFATKRKCRIQGAGDTGDVSEEVCCTPQSIY